MEDKSQDQDNRKQEEVWEREDKEGIGKID